MARLTMAQAYAYARQAGFSAPSAVIAAAIGMAESGLVTNARGDLGRQTDYWGPSVGLMQIRTVKSETGTGSDRDITRLSDPLQNMIAAYHISHSGRDFSPWTTYNNQAYRQFLGQAGNAAGTVVPAAATGSSGLVDAIGGRLQTMAITGLAVAAGVALVVLGGYRAVGSPRPPGGVLAAAL